MNYWYIKLQDKTKVYMDEIHTIIIILDFVFSLNLEM